MKVINTILLIAVLLLASFMGTKWLQKKQTSDVIQVERVQALQDCDPSLRACDINVSNHKVTLSFLQTASALKPFPVLILADIPGLQQAGLRFYMQGMDMGFNTFEMLQVEEGKWQADVILPVCSTGSKNWHVELQLLFENHLVISDFYFKQSN